MERPRQFSFDEAAELYDRHRPGYPEGLFDDMIELSGIVSRDRVLEIGCGTGQATAPIAARGCRVLALEPGPNLARLARDRLRGFPDVEILCKTFESWPVEPGAFGLVVSAQAFHWLSPELRFAKASQALRRGGALAVIGNPVMTARSPLLAEIEVAYARHAPSLVGPPPMSWYTEDGPLVALFEGSSRFGPVSVTRHPWSRRYTSADYVGLLRTHSDHRLLPPEPRESLHAAIADAIEGFGGSIEIAYEASLYLARRAP